MSTACIISLIVLIAIIVIGMVFNINLGLLGIIGAYICGCFLAGMQPMALINTWPITLMFQGMCALMFFSFATNNGALELMATKVVNKFGKMPYLIPVVLYVILAVIAAMGVGAGVVFFMAVPVCIIAKKIHMKPTLTAITMISGINTGAWFITGNDGILASGILASAGFAAEDLSALSVCLGKNYIIAGIFIFILGYIIFGGWKCTALEEQEIADFTPKQKQSLILTFIMVLVYVVPTLLNLIVDNTFVALVAGKLNIAFVAIIFTLIGVLMKLDTFDNAVKSVPWNTFMVVCGMGMMISVCVEVGLIESVSAIISANVSDAILPYVLTITGGVMSLFTATIGVVLPTMYPVINALTATTSVSAGLMISALTLGSGFMGISPFSTMGAMTLNAVEEEDKQSMFVSLFIAVVFSLAVILLLTALHIISG